jgi:hypothetical protein
MCRAALGEMEKQQPWLLWNHQHHARLHSGDVRVVLLDGFDTGVVIRGDGVKRLARLDRVVDRSA